MIKLSKLKISRRLLFLLVLVVVAGLVFAGLHIHNVHEAQGKSGTIPTSKKNGENDTSGSKTKKTSASSSKDAPASTPSSDKSTSTSTNSSVVLIAPFGTFVSNHKPGNGSPTSEQSVCNTTPGAICDIQFTNSSGVTKTLGAQTTNSSGSTYWSWNVDGATLAPGSWHITAVVKLNGQTKTATDPTPLEVQ